MESKKYVLLEGVEELNRFFCPNTDKDPTKLSDGRTAFRILGYADTIEEAQFKLYGHLK